MSTIFPKQAASTRTRVTSSHSHPNKVKRDICHAYVNIFRPRNSELFTHVHVRPTKCSQIFLSWRTHIRRCVNDISLLSWLHPRVWPRFFAYSKLLYRRLLLGCTEPVTFLMRSQQDQGQNFSIKIIWEINGHSGASVDRLGLITLRLGSKDLAMLRGKLIWIRVRHM